MGTYRTWMREQGLEPEDGPDGYDAMPKRLRLWLRGHASNKDRSAAGQLPEVQAAYKAWADARAVLMRDLHQMPSKWNASMRNVDPSPIVDLEGWKRRHPNEWDRLVAEAAYDRRIQELREATRESVRAAAYARAAARAAEEVRARVARELANERAGKRERNRVVVPDALMRAVKRRRI